MNLKDLRNKKIEEPVFVGFLFGIMFWFILDSIILGVTLGFIFAIALKEEEKRRKK
jgi:hypothetical protein